MHVITTSAYHLSVAKKEVSLKKNLKSIIVYTGIVNQVKMVY